jgi:cytochrome bd ubiquinol oxidase subunit II
MDYVVIVYLWLSILLYLILGGADFGAGIIELVTARKDRSATRHILHEAIGPIWEANHMWLVIAIVILFVGFPVIYSTVSVSLHIPLLIMLLGIIARGTAFTFRNYDAVKDDLQWWYTRIFVLSSFITPFFLGIIAGSTISGRIVIHSGDFMEAFIFSWLDWFSVSVGLFTVALCGFLASVYLIGETRDPVEKKRYAKTAKEMNIAAVAFGALVFIAASLEDVPLSKWIFTETIPLIAVIAASCSLALLWYRINKGNSSLPRLLAGFQVTMILLAVGYGHFPDLIIVGDGEALSLLTHQAPEKTMKVLGIALLAGSIFILPALGYLYWSFERRKE